MDVRRDPNRLAPSVVAATRVHGVSQRAGTPCRRGSARTSREKLTRTSREESMD